MSASMSALVGSSNAERVSLASLPLLYQTADSTPLAPHSDALTSQGSDWLCLRLPKTTVESYLLDRKSQTGISRLRYPPGALPL